MAQLLGLVVQDIIAKPGGVDLAALANVAASGHGELEGRSKPTDGGLGTSSAR